MAKNRITEEKLVDKEIYNIGRNYAKGLQPAIDANEKFLQSFKANAKGYAEISKEFKKATTDNKKFLQLKKEEERLRKEVANALKAEEAAKAAALRTQKTAVGLEKSQLDLEAKKERQAQRSKKLTIEERVEQQHLNKIKREQAKITLGLVGPYDKLSKELNEARKRAKDLGVQFGMNSKQFKTAQREVNALDGRLKKLDTALGQSQRYVGNYERSMRGLVGIFRNLSGALGLMGGLYAFVSVVRNAAKRIREFDKEMQNLSGILGKNRDEISALEQSIISVAGSSIKTSNEVAKLATALISLGKTEDEVQLLLEPVNNLGVALQTTGDQAGELLIQTLNAFGKGAESGQEFADIIAKMRTSTALDFERISDSLGYLAPTANALGLSLEETGAILGTLNDNGIKAARAGRLMSSSFARLVSNGMTLDEALSQINESTNKVGTATQLFGAESFSLALILADNIEKTNEYTKSFQNAGGALEDLTNKQLESVDSKIKILDSTWEELVLSIENGEGSISQSFKTIIESVTGFLELLIQANKTVEEIKANVRTEDLKNDIKADQEEIGVIFESLSRNYEKSGKAIDETALKINAATLLAQQLQDQMDNYDTTEDQNENYTKRIEAIQSYIQAVKDSNKEEVDLTKNSSKEAEKAAKDKNDLLKKYAEDRFNLQVFLLEEQIRAEEQTVEDEKELWFNRYTALDNQYKLEEQLAKLNAERKFELTETFSKEELEYFKQNGRLRADQVKQLTDEELLIYKQYLAELKTLQQQGAEGEAGLDVERMERQAERIKNIREKEMEEELQRENDLFQQKQGDYANELTAVENLEKRKAEIKKQYAIAGYQAQVEQIEKLLQSEDLSADERARYERELAGIKRQISDLTTEDFIENNQEQIEATRRKVETIASIEQQLSSTLRAVSDAVYGTRIDRIQEEIDANNEKYEQWLENENLTTEQKEEIEAQRREKEKELEKKQREEQRKQAILNKAMTAAQIGIQTSLAVVQALAAPPGVPFTIPMGVLAGTLGAIELAAVLATPIPKYAKGTEDHPGGWAEVGEERPEVIEEPGKAPYIQKQRAVLNLPKHTKVTPSVEEYEKLKRASILSSVAIDNKKLNDFQSSQAFNSNKELIDKLDSVEKTIAKSKAKVTVNPSKSPDINHELFRFKNTNWNG